MKRPYITPRLTSHQTLTLALRYITGPYTAKEELNQLRIRTAKELVKGTWK